MAAPPPNDALDRRLRLGTAAGAVLWPLWWILGGAGSGVGDVVGLALVGGLLVVVPLALLLSREPDRAGGDHPAFRWAVGSLLLSVPTGLLSMLGSPGGVSAGLAVPWVATTLLVGLWGLARLGRRPHLDLPETCIDVGLIYLPVAGVWLLASRAGQPLLGFSEPWVSLTATHFHFAALGVPVMAGAVGRALPALEREGREAFGVVGGWRVVAWLAMLGPALTAAGIAAWPLLETVGAVVMSGAAIGVGGYFVLLAAGSTLPRASRRVLWIAGPLPVATGALAVLFSLSQLMDEAGFPSYAVMARYHGFVNAVGFVAAGMAALALARLGPDKAPGIPFSRLRGGRFVGRWFFRSQGLVDEGAPAPRGLVDTLDVFAREGVDGLHPLGRDGGDGAVEGGERLLAVHALGARHEPAGVDGVGGSARMGEQAGVRAGREQGSGAAGMVEVDVGDDHVGHVFGAKLEATEGREDGGHRLAGVRLDDHRAVVVGHDVGRGAAGNTGVAGVDEMDGHEGLLRGGVGGQRSV